MNEVLTLLWQGLGSFRGNQMDWLSLFFFWLTAVEDCRCRSRCYAIRCGWSCWRQVLLCVVPITRVIPEHTWAISVLCIISYKLYTMLLWRIAFFIWTQSLNTALVFSEHCNETMLTQQNFRNSEMSYIRVSWTRLGVGGDNPLLNCAPDIAINREYAVVRKLQFCEKRWIFRTSKMYF